MTGATKLWFMCERGNATPDTVSKKSKDASLVAKLLSKGVTMNPLSYSFDKVEWAVFGTLTWDNDETASYYNPLSEQMRRRDFYLLIRSLCHELKLRGKDLCFYHKTEWGDNLRGHYNVLIAKHGTKAVTPDALASAMQRLWTGGKYPRGLAMVQPFDSERHLAGVLYQTKNEFDARGNALPFYEEHSKGLLKLLHNV